MSKDIHSLGDTLINFPSSIDEKKEQKLPSPKDGRIQQLSKEVLSPGESEGSKILEHKLQPKQASESGQLFQQTFPKPSKSSELVNAIKDAIPFTTPAGVKSAEVWFRQTTAILDYKKLVHDQFEKREKKLDANKDNRNYATEMAEVTQGRQEINAIIEDRLSTQIERSPPNLPVEYVNRLPAEFSDRLRKAS